MDVLDDEFKVTTHYLLINSAQLVALYHFMKSESKTKTNGIIEMLCCIYERINSSNKDTETPKKGE